MKPGRILYEMIGVPEDVARDAFRTAEAGDRHHDQVRVADEGAVVRAEAVPPVNEPFKGLT